MTVGQLNRKNMYMKLIPLIALMIFLTACGGAETNAPQQIPEGLVPVDTAGTDNAIVHGRAIYTVESAQRTAMYKLFNSMLFPTAYAATGTSTVTYTNGASTNFTINVAAFAAGSFTGNTLSLGHVDISTLSDNNLKVCGAGGSTKCTQAAIRVYTTGSTAGFVNTADVYGVPVYAGSLNPASPVGLLAAGSVQVQTLSIPTSKRTVAIADFPTPAYAVTSDFSNGGAGAYSMSFVVEYILLP